MSRRMRCLSATLTALAVGLFATAAWAQEGGSPSSPATTASPTPSPSGDASPAPSSEESPSPAPEESPSPSPSPSTTASPSPSPTPSVTPTEQAREKSAPQGTSVNDLGLSIGGIPTPAQVGDPVVIDVLVSNLGTQEQNVTLSVELPQELEFVSSTPAGFVAGGGPPPLGEFVGIPIGTIAPGTSATATIRTKAVAPTADGGALLAIDAEDANTSAVASETLEVVIVEDDRATGDLALEAVPASRLLAKVGDELDHELVVSNTGDEPLRSVVIVERVAPEINVIGAPLVRGVDAVQIGRYLEQEDIVWVIDKLAPGKKVRLPWRSVVQEAGDLEVTTSARARAEGAEPATASAENFLASPETPTEPENPPFTPIRKRVAIVVPAVGSVDGVLPLTGVTVWWWVGIGVLSMLVGMTLWRLSSPSARSRRVPAAVWLLCVLTAACVSSSDDIPQAGDRTPEVKGKRIERGGDEPSDPAGAEPDEENGSDGDGNQQQDTGGGNDGTGGTDEGDGEPEPPTVVGTDPSPDPDPVTNTVPPAEEDTIAFVTRSITLSDLPVGAAESVSGSSGTFTWDEGARAITSATSQRMLLPDQAFSVLTEVRDDDGTITVTVTLRNESEDERLAVNGHFVHSVGDTELRSNEVDTILSPRGDVTATYEYLLPSGTYNVGGSFVAE